MDEMEKRLTALGTDYGKIEAPEEMAERLTAALQSKTAPSRPKRKWIAAAVVVLLLFGYSWDALAYYGKKILGYEQVSTGSVQDLLAQGRGQQIDKSATFSNGIKVTLDGLIMDGKGFTTFIKVEYPEGYGDPFDSDASPQFDLKGILGYTRGSGSGEQKGNKVYWARTFDDEPMLLEKRMALVVSMTINGEQEKLEIPFTLNRSEAYVPVAGKIKIGQKIASPYGTIYFDTLQASALNTVVTGRIENMNLGDTDRDLLPRDPARPLPHLNFTLTNGDRKLSPQSSSLNSQNDRDFQFEFKFDGIDKLENMKLTDIQFEETVMVDKEIELKPGMAAVALGGEAEEATLQQVAMVDGNTVVTIRQRPELKPILGFFRGDTQIAEQMSEKEADSFVIREYVLKGQGVRMDVKGIVRTYPLKELITIN